jgi:hypothetical protein
MPELDSLTAHDFAPLRNQPFQLAPERGQPIELELVEVDAAEGAGGRPFSVVFRGPGEPVLPQRIYRIEHATFGSLELFIVPIGRDADGIRYEAVFT